jgi:hypothetical protein
MGALPGAAIYGAGSYFAGQMMEGAQFGNEMGSMLQRNFRFTNPQSRTGYGFSQQQQQQLTRMTQEMGTRDMMTTPRELMGVMEGAAQMGMFRGVQDAREFKRRFSEMKDSLKEIAQTFNTTLSDALPFLGQARQMGFWSPQDVTRHSRQVRQVQANTGLTADQVQQSMALGSQMVRSLGGTGQQGAQMMARSQGMAGAAMFGNVLGERELANAGFGMGAQGTANLGNMLGGMSARFARSRVGRWTLASLMNREGTGLDPAGLSALASGGLSVGQIGARARRNVSGGRAYQFVQNEEELRGQLAQAGPQAAMGIVRSLAGGRLWGESSKDRLITNRMIRRFMGGSKRQAELIAKMAREMPRIMQVQAARAETSLDAQGRQRDEQLTNTFEGFKRRMGQFWNENVSGPMQQMGTEFTNTLGRTWQKFTDNLFRTKGRGLGLGAEAVRSMARGAETGNLTYLQEAMGPMGITGDVLGGQFTGGGRVGVEGSRLMKNLGFRPTGMGGMIGSLLGERSFSAGDVGEMRALQEASGGVVGTEQAQAIGFGGTGAMRAAMGGTGAQQLQQYMRSAEALRVRQREGEGGVDYARSLLGKIRGGAAGGAAQRLFEGLEERQAIGRLAALQGGKVRGGFTGVAALGDAGIGANVGQDIREQIADFQESSVTSLAETVQESMSFWEARTTGQYEQGIEELSKDSRGDQAMRLFARAQYAEEQEKNPKKAARLRDQARKSMREIALDTESGISERAREIAIKMGDPNSPHSKAFERSAGNLGKGKMVADRQLFSDQTKRRRARMREGLKGRAGERLRELAGEDTEMRGALEAALSGTGDPQQRGMITGEMHVQQMRDLARLAAEDPDKAARMAAVLRAEGMGGTEMGLILEGGGRIAGMVKQFGVSEEQEERLAGGGGGRSMRKARAGIMGVMAEMGMDARQMGGKTITSLIRGDSEEARKKMEDFLRTKKGWKNGPNAWWSYGS